jgi:pSer/pThr/pTyr-binding forkhead associated (FHA) protein
MTTPRIYWTARSGAVQMNEVGVRPLTLGTHDCCAVTLMDGAPVHASLSREGGEVWIRGLSRAATLTVNGEPCAAASLNHGDRIVCGSQELTYVDSGGVPSRMLRLSFSRVGDDECVELEHPGAEIIIGRKGSDVVVEDDSLSRHHLAIEHYGEGMLWVRDLESTNGSSVAGKPLTSRIDVVPGVVVQMGRIQVHITVGDAPPKGLGEVPARRVVFGQSRAHA